MRLQRNVFVLFLNSSKFEFKQIPNIFSLACTFKHSSSIRDTATSRVKCMSRKDFPKYFQNTPHTQIARLYRAFRTDSEAVIRCWSHTRLIRLKCYRSRMTLKNIPNMKKCFTSLCFIAAMSWYDWDYGNTQHFETKIGLHAILKLLTVCPTKKIHFTRSMT